jgi:hypothetical protein
MLLVLHEPPLLTDMESNAREYQLLRRLNGEYSLHSIRKG